MSQEFYGSRSGARSSARDRVIIPTHSQAAEVSGSPNRTVGGKKDGAWITHYADGTKRSEGAYVAGVKHGKWMQYDKNGKPAAEATFHEGKYVGRYRAFHENGKLKMEGHYNPIRSNSADGTKEGEFKYYNTDGKTIWRIITYKRGSRTKPDELPTPRDF